MNVRDSQLMISVVVPLYNVEKFINKCVDSIINQTYKKIEIILVDDGSTDSTSVICDEYAKNDNRVKVIHKKNGGLVSARKAGKRVATGDYLMDVDGDDWIESDRIEIIVDAIMHNPVDVVYTSGMYRDTEYSSVLSEYYFDKKMIFEGNSICHDFLPLIADVNKTFGKVLLRNSYLWIAKADLGKMCQGKVNDDVSMGEDCALTFYYVQYCKSVMIIPNHTYHYFQRDKSISHNMFDIAQLQSLAKSLNYELGMRLCEIDSKIMNQYLTYYQTVLCSLCINKESGILYPYSDIGIGSKIAVYGCGGYGHRFVLRMLETNACSVSCWVDRNVRLYDGMPIKVSEVSSLLEADFEYVVIAIINEDIAREVKRNLIEMGIEESKIAMMDKKYMDTEEFKSLFKIY